MKIQEYLEKNKNDKNYKLINELFQFNILKNKPSKKEIKEFESRYEYKYPTEISDLNKELLSYLKTALEFKKQYIKFEEKKQKERAKQGYATSDTWDIQNWFLDIMPKMLTEMRDNLHGNPVPLIPLDLKSVRLDESEKNESEDFIAWKNKLDEMIFLLNEMNENTCSYKNKYEKEYYDILDDFYTKYGIFGDKLKTKEELEEEKKTHLSKMLGPEYAPEEYPNFLKLQYKYFLDEQRIYMYRDKCKEKFFHLFSEVFWDLWD